MSDEKAEFYTEVGRRICQAMESRAKTPADLTLITGLSRASVLNIGAGRQAISLIHLVKIAKAWNIPIGEFVPDSLPQSVRDSLNNTVHVSRSADGALNRGSFAGIVLTEISRTDDKVGS